MWDAVPLAARAHLDRASFKEDFLAGEAWKVVEQAMAKQEPQESPEKRLRRSLQLGGELPGEAALPPAAWPGLGSPQTVQEILVNGRSSNTLQVWVLAAQGTVQSKKTGRGKQSCLYTCLVHDGQDAAVLSAWGEMARVVSEGVKGRQQQGVLLSQIGASTRSVRLGLAEVVANRGVRVQPVELTGACPAPPFTNFLHLAEDCRLCGRTRPVRSCWRKSPAAMGTWH